MSTKRHDTQVSRAATHLPPFEATTISKRFAQKHSAHWQAHLKRVSPFLVYGINVWWHSSADNYVFHDGTNDPEYHPEGPAFCTTEMLTLKVFVHVQSFVGVM